MEPSEAKLDISQVEECFICCNAYKNNCYTTNCCKNNVHKKCLVYWFIYKTSFNCPLCRSTNITIPLPDLMKFKKKVSNQHLENLNVLINKINTR